MNHVLIYGFILILLLSTGNLHADDTKVVAGKKRTAIDFSDELVEGKAKSPELFYLLQKKQINFGRLIKLRENFLPEMKSTTEDIKRGGGEE